MGEFGAVKLGMSRREIGSLLGEPDFFIDVYQETPDCKTAGIWSYAGMEFRFGDYTKVTDAEILPDILDHFMFRPIYLWYRRDGEAKTRLNRWVFRSRKGPVKELFCEALTREAIQFSDSGEFKVVFNAGDHRITALPIDAPHEDQDPDIHSVIITSSGIEVIFDGEDLIDRVLFGASWEYVQNWREMAGPLPPLKGLVA